MKAEFFCCASGESLVRQILEGRQLFVQEFGFEPREVWVPHCSTLSAALPQILRKAGFESARLNKVSSWPQQEFLWEGIDGSRVFAFSGEAADPVSHPKRRFAAADGFLLSTDCDEALDEQAPRGLESLAEADALPVWFGQLGDEGSACNAHLKREIRENELLLRDAEFFQVVAASVPADRPMNEETPNTKHAWKLLLQHRETSDEQAHEPSAHDNGAISALARAMLEAKRRRLVEAVDTSTAREPLIVFNTTSHTRAEVVSLPDGAPARVEVPPCGYTVLDAAEHRPVASFAAPVEVIGKKRVTAIDNGMLRLIFDEKGMLHNIRDHRLRREVLASHEQQILRVRSNERAVTTLQHFEVVEQTPLRARVEIGSTYGSSRVLQRITVCAGSPRIDFETEIDWHDDFLDVIFQLNLRAPHATCEIEFGSIEVLTHANTSADDVRVQRWVDLSEGDYGVALLTDRSCSCHVRGNSMGLNLLQASDSGAHHLTYALLPHLSDFRTGQVIQHAYNLNAPLQVIPAAVKEGKLPKTRSFFEVDRAGVVIEAVKMAEDGDGVIVRLYEAFGTRGRATLRTSLPIKNAFATDLLERVISSMELSDGEIAFQITPFEIVTLKLLLA